MTVAVESWELPQIEHEDRPQLRVVPGTASGRPGGKPGWAAFFAVVLIAVVAAPSAGAALFAPNGEIGWARRPPAAVEIMELDPVSPLPNGKRPGSSLPVVGYAFVRCTRLWTAFPDGSHQRKVIQMPGISSPAFAPDARSIAFFVDAGEGQDLWVASADGRERLRIGALRSGGFPFGARATGLTWSPDGSQLAFALVEDAYGEFEGGSAIWKLDLASGKFRKEGSGWPAPFWVEGKLAYSKYHGGQIAFKSRTHRRYAIRPLWTSGDDLAAGQAPYGWRENWRGAVALLTRSSLTSPPGKQELLIRDRYSDRNQAVVRPPNGYRFAPHARPEVAQDASTVAIGLVDRSGERDLGVLDPRFETWRVLDYAWEPTASAAPVVTGSLDQRRAVEALEELMNFWRDFWTWKGGIERRLLMPQGNRSVIPFSGRFIQYVAGTPERTDAGWSIPASVLGEWRDGWAFRQVLFEVSVHRRALRVRTRPMGAVQRLDSIESAIDFASSALGRALPVPSVPSGAHLLPSTMEASSYGGRSIVSFKVGLPRQPGGSGRRSRMGFGFGTVGFMEGCGDSVIPRPIRLGSSHALLDDTSNMSQVIWPARTIEDQGFYSVSGTNVSNEVVLETARTMETSTR